MNHSNAIVTNSYLNLYPKPYLEKEICAIPELKSQLFVALNLITRKSMLDEGRVYGGGMYKLEPSELSNVPAIEIANLLTIILNKEMKSESDSAVLHRQR